MDVSGGTWRSAAGRARVGVGVHDALTARLAERSGFDTLWLGSLEVSSSRGLPDVNLLSLHDMAAATRDVRSASTLPLLVDVDTGYGSDETAVRALLELEAAGAFAICIEDSAFPKRNSLFPVAGRSLEDAEVFTRRLRKLVAARRSVKIIARTEALVAGLGPEAAISRLQSYAEAGADALFAQVDHTNRDSLPPVVRAVRGLAPVVLAPTALPGYSVQDWEEVGADVVLFANVVVRTMVSSLSRMLVKLRDAGSASSVDDDLVSLPDLFSLTDTAGWISEGRPTDPAQSPAGPERPQWPPAAGDGGTFGGVAAEPIDGQADEPVSTDKVTARKRMGARRFDYCAGAAGDEATMRRNEAALDGVRLTPRVLTGGSGPRLSVQLLGRSLAAPIVVSPMGLQELCHADAELATAAAAAEAGVGFCLSAFGSRTPEEVAGAAPEGMRLFQLYLLRDREITASLVRRAEATGFCAVVVTVDVPVLGDRRRDWSHAFDRFTEMPPALLQDPVLHERYGTDPVARRQGLDAEFPYQASWSDLRRVVESTTLPVLVKGILHPDDVQRALDIGARGVVVSTHGGRQFDRLPSSAEALYRIRKTLPDALLLLDSGVRRGRHVAAALALGADAVFVGRPVLWGLASAGLGGARRVLDQLCTDLRQAMTLTGAADAEGMQAVPADADWMVEQADR